MVAAFPIQGDSASSAIPSNAGLGDEPETFRQRWQAIVGGLHTSGETTGDDAPAADSLRETGVAISGKEPAAIAANKGQVIKDKAASATGKLAPERASTANATALSPPIVLQSSPVPDATCVDPSHPPAKGSTGDFTSHAKRPSRRTDQSVAQPIAGTSSATKAAPDSEFMILPPSAPHPGVPLAAENTLQPRFSAPEFLNRNGSLPGHRASRCRAQQPVRCDLLSWPNGKWPQRTCPNRGSPHRRSPIEMKACQAIGLFKCRAQQSVRRRLL